MSTTVTRANVFDVDPKRSYEKVPVTFDFHDIVASLRQTGIDYAIGQRFRPRRLESNGFEYECTVAGRSARHRLVLPTADTEGATRRDGSVTWTVRKVSAASLRTSIQTSNCPAVTGLTLSGQGLVNDGLVHAVFVDGGTSGQTYDIPCQMVTANGEEYESVARMLVQD